MTGGIRSIGVEIGDLLPGSNNDITDVPGVWVGHETVISDDPHVVRTGVTVITAREDRIWSDYAYCAWHRFNGNGELTGIPWMEESGMLGSAIGLTNTHQVGLVRDELVRYTVDKGLIDGFSLPVVAETFDGWLSDIDTFPLRPEHVRAALGAMRPGPIPQGNVGGGTGMICHEFKGGIGSASRVVAAAGEQFTVGVLVQANYGLRGELRVDGVPVGRQLYDLPSAYLDTKKKGDGSIIIIVATDAPLIPTQCARLAQRTVVGLGRVGGTGRNGSGDIALAFATGNELPARVRSRQRIDTLSLESLNPFFTAVADATEEAILNALAYAEDMAGYQGRFAPALPLDRVAEIYGKYQSRKRSSRR